MSKGEYRDRGKTNIGYMFPIKLGLGTPELGPGTSNIGFLVNNYVNVQIQRTIGLNLGQKSQT